ncbi:MAG: phosphate ABC transporter substrate-binding protein PstS [Candidatus Atelocyanobacterium sp. ALOHA_A2.5_9]|nr:phosphate ABC transporter substrate-binding protein PstS [Candidatus Atelocyanobacterium sp. ALOHA_A2.5_9]|tara:strand:- start:16223 stop:17380 length:1158 start_codon:yes stop_codon:yes gene_type:complete
MFKTVKSIKQTITSLSIITLVAALESCGGNPSDVKTIESNPQIDIASKFPIEENVSLIGTGGSFPAPLYQNWFAQIHQSIPNLQIDYQSMGSGTGVRQFTMGIVDFGASDVAMEDAEISRVDKGVYMLPITAGSIVIAYNVPGITELKLSREVYVDIFSGKITYWDDPKISSLNPNQQLPNLPITVVHRSDGSGTTGVFTKHLSTISQQWETDIGQGRSVEWPITTGKFIGGKRNAGVTALIQQNKGAIGYIEYGYAKNSQLPTALLENASGNYIEANSETASKTLEAVSLPDNLRAFITDPQGEDSYPIVTYTWILAYESYDDPKKAIAMETMIEYALTEGQNQSKALGYITLPLSVRKKVAMVADTISPDYDINLTEFDQTKQ